MGAMIGFLVGHRICTHVDAMRDYDEDDPKKPQPVLTPKKGANEPEAVEAGRWHLTHKDHDRDRHRHVV